jgi:spore coat protein U-like protein
MAIGSAQPHTVHGVLPDNANNQAAPAGSYNDTITVTVTY